MDNVIIGISLSAVIYLVYLFVIILNKKRLNKYINSGKETTMIKHRYKIDYNMLSYKLVSNLFAVSNALILGITYIIISFIPTFILKLVLALILLIVLLSVTYLNIGKYLKRKEGK